MPVRTDHVQPVKDAAFAGNLTVPVTNEHRGTTLIATLRVISFTGGVAQGMTVRLFFVNLDGVRTPATKINGGGGVLAVPGTHVLGFGPATAQQGATDPNIGALPRNFEIDLLSSGDQTSADITFDVVLA